MKVSVVVTTYKHEKYIAKCLESILMQETDFPFELLIGAEQGDEETIKICRRYKVENPNDVFVFVNDKDNVIKVNGNRTGRANWLNVLQHAKGEYIARCDGDDFWTDKKKLQKQVDFLDAHLEYNICGHLTQEVGQGNNVIPSHQLTTLDERFLIGKNAVPLSTMVARSSIFKPLHPFFKEKPAPLGDRMMNYLGCKNNGKIYCMQEVLGAYTVHSGGIFSGAKYISRVEQDAAHLFYVYEAFFPHMKNDRLYILARNNIFIKLFKLYLRNEPRKIPFLFRQKKLYAIKFDWKYLLQKLRII